MAVGGIWGRATADAGDKIGESGEADGLAILAVRADKHRAAHKGGEAVTGRGGEGPAAGQAAAFYGGHLK